MGIPAGICDGYCLRHDGSVKSSSRLRLVGDRTPESATWTDGDPMWHRQLGGERGGEAPTLEADAHAVASVLETRRSHGIVPSVVQWKGEAHGNGYSGLVIGRAAVDEPELAYELFQQAHGNGYATEAGVAVVGAAAATGRSRLWSTVRIWNTQSFQSARQARLRPSPQRMGRRRRTRLERAQTSLIRGGVSLICSMQCLREFPLLYIM